MSDMIHPMAKAMGRGLDDCHFLGFRYDRDFFGDPETESWVVRCDHGRLELLRGACTWYTDLWRSPTGRLFVAEDRGVVHVCDAPTSAAAPWTSHELPFRVHGLWGLDDACVFAFNSRNEDHPRDPALARWDGRTWRVLPSPPGGDIQALHGIAPDFVYAVGIDGMIARWDGAQWHAVPSPTRDVLSSVYVVSRDEIYACGRGRRLLEGSVYGWSVVSIGGTLMGVAKWQDQVWVADSGEGLKRLENNRLVVVAGDLHASALCPAGDVLLFTGSDQIAETRDGKTFRKIMHYALEDALANVPPLYQHTP